MNQKIKSLYLHIPFCKSICSYCDFVRTVPKSSCEVHQYVEYVINEIKKQCKNRRFSTIYIGGGTPNSLNNYELERLLSCCCKHLTRFYEFTIECNPEFITDEQVAIFKKYHINRISLGVQSLNNDILKDFNRKHTADDVKKALTILRNHHINNISCDFIYGYNRMTTQDIVNNIKFIINSQIPHVSFYSLELKENSCLTKTGYTENEELIDQQLKLIVNEMQKYKYYRYEVSNWCVNKKYQCQHNLTYWKSLNWKAIGYGAYGFENPIYYWYIKQKNKIVKKVIKYQKRDYYFQIFMMGLRLTSGIDLSIKDNLLAYHFFKKLIPHNLVSIKNHHLIAKNINQIDNILIELI